ncbi:uncharacterized protein BO66DRAFT_447585 [Aspergillus aculeatinus CBS 121060]|uniref:Uncharacterized protein n=1 Tax=Aspergillus aculeatinus CBS 121060 TaxID=1448322 RepID=A0ACD1HE16_9EURO|nr:hypothetical protein BO66DRAFT_447585 [Aspergillus aculeatinus CBS 121060]RAH71900.1 hypothetical protein BO66DRAFT_447585 [Aspergillus aculeatinus CBS 121060]
MQPTSKSCLKQITESSAAAYLAPTSQGKFKDLKRGTTQIENMESLHDSRQAGLASSNYVVALQSQFPQAADPDFRVFEANDDSSIIGESPGTATIAKVKHLLHLFYNCFNPESVPWNLQSKAYDRSSGPRRGWSGFMSPDHRQNSYPVDIQGESPSKLDVLTSLKIPTAMPFGHFFRHADEPAAHQGWGPLITDSKQPNPLFTRLLDAIFIYFTHTPPVDSRGFDPVKYASVFTALFYSDNSNLSRRYYMFASENHMPAPEQFAYQAMTIFYRTHDIQHVMNGQTPVMTRDGFHLVMLRDTLGDPEIQCQRFNAFLAAHGGDLVDPMTGRRFPSVPIPRDSVPRERDSETWSREAEMNRDFNEELGIYLEELNRMGAWSHDTTMASMSPGVWQEIDGILL